MNRESDEECLALIATIRERGLGVVLIRSEVERLLVNLEARIKEMSRESGVVAHADCRRMVEEIRIDREACRAENLRLHAKLEEAGKQIVGLTSEVDRRWRDLAVIGTKLVSLLPEQVAKEALRELRVVGIVIGVCDENDVLSTSAEAVAKQELEAGAYCPCGTETCREAWRELRQAKHAAEQGAIRFRDMIREEVAKETAESSREIAVQLMALGERLSAVELHEAANEPGQASFRLRNVLREEVAAEVARQMQAIGGTISDALRKIADAIEAEAS